MKRWSYCVASLIAIAIVAVTAAGCGGSDGTATSGDSGTQQGGPVGQAEATACPPTAR